MKRKEQLTINLCSIKRKKFLIPQLLNRPNKCIEQSQNRKIIAKFLDEVPDTLGWWYRIPKLSQEWNNTQLKLIKKCGKVLPHFGSIFGISEDAMALILEAMGCLQKHGNRRCHVCKAGWEALIAEFKVKGKIKISLTRIEGASISYV